MIRTPSLERSARLRRAIIELYHAATATIGSAKAGNLAHDALSDNNMLGTFANHWEHYCRITGHNPYRKINEDGTIVPLIPHK